MVNCRVLYLNDYFTATYLYIAASTMNYSTIFYNYLYYLSWMLLTIYYDTRSTPSACNDNVTHKQGRDNGGRDIGPMELQEESESGHEYRQ